MEHHGNCHCGAVKLRLPSTPETGISCNCSLCRRHGGPWAYYEFGSVQIDDPQSVLRAYVWGDRTLRTMHCSVCASVTHWEPIDGQLGARHGVNLSNFDPVLVASVRVRRFDGADTWTFIDE